MIDPQKITVMILAAGLGTRLRPLTNTLPKQMLPLSDGKPVLEHILVRLRDQGFRNFIINLHHLPEKITDYFGDGAKWGVSIEYSDETNELMETAGAIKKVQEHLTDPFVLYYGDVFGQYDFKKALEIYEKNAPLGVLALKRSGLLHNGDIAELDPETGQIIAWHERPHAIEEYGDKYYTNGGLYILSKKILDYIPHGEPSRLDIHIIPPLIKSGAKFYGLMSDTVDIGSVEKYEEVKERHREQSI